MRTILLSVFACIITVSLLAGPVSEYAAKQAALRHYTVMSQKTLNKIPAPLHINLAMVYTAQGFGIDYSSGNDVDLFYVFNINQNEGFIILSADDRANPVIGYSLKGTWSGQNLPNGLQGLLQRRAEELTALLSAQTVASPQVASAWSELLDGKSTMNFKSFTAVDPLMTTTWDQAPYYNELCPYDYNYNELTVTGCPATAMAQIMKYWNYPLNGVGYHSYNSENYGTLSANFEATTYNWSGMPNSINGSNNAIATLMFHCGVSVEMQYGVAATGGSGGYVIEAQSPITHCCEYAFKTYFGYKNTLQGLFRESYNDATWIQMLKTDLDAGRPIQYAGFGQGGGHTWVCDGYDDNNFFHMNWGWGGTYDGYYSLNNLSPGTGGAGGGSGSFNSGQQALIGIEPGSGGGGGGGGTQFDLRAYSPMYVDPLPINFTYEFDVTIDIINSDETNFSGGLAAALFNEQGDFVDFIAQLTGVSLTSGYYNTYFFHNDGMLATPGLYYIGIYYKTGTADWAIIGSGNYNNYASVQIVGPPNEMEMYSSISLNPLNIVSNESFQIEFNIGNYGNQNFNGWISADLYDAEGNYLDELAITEFFLPSMNWNTIQFNCAGVDVAAGSYILAIWETEDGENWDLVGSSDYPNPITISIAAPQIPGDQYEDNDSELQAYLLPLNIPGNQVVIATTGSTIHNGNDMDYYKINLPSGYQFRITPRAHDSYNSGNGLSYTDDVLWAIGNGTEWSEVYDDVSDGYFPFEGGQTAYFVVSNYYQGQTGTYLLDITVEKGPFGINEITDDNLVNLFPNPTSGLIRLSSARWSEFGSSIEINIADMTGRKDYELTGINPSDSDITLDLQDLKEGVYYLRLSGKNGYINKKLVIIR